MNPYEVWARVDGTWRWCFPLFAADRHDARRQSVAIRDSRVLPRWAYDSPLSVRTWKSKPQRWAGLA